MSNTTALVLALLIMGAVGADIWYSGGETLVFLGKKLAVLIEWMAFWR